MTASALPVVVACDLDRTLIYSPRAAEVTAAGGPTGEAETGDSEGGPASDQDALECVEHYEGRPLSFLTRRASRLLVELAARSVFVPATTRTRAQLARVRLPGPAPHYAVAANGGFLLVDGQPDVTWTQLLTARLGRSAATLDEIRAHVTGVLAEDLTSALRCAEDLFLYAVVVRERLPVGLVEDLQAWAAGHGWGVSLQGRKLYVVPTVLTKSAAVAEIARRTGASTVLAAGDSLLDRGLLDAADAAVRPAHGELHAADWAPGHVTVTPSSGIIAGEQILDWLLARVG